MQVMQGRTQVGQAPGLAVLFPLDLGHQAAPAVVRPGGRSSAARPRASLKYNGDLEGCFLLLIIYYTLQVGKYLLDWT